MFWHLWVISDRSDSIVTKQSPLTFTSQYYLVDPRLPDSSSALVLLWDTISLLTICPDTEQSNWMEWLWCGGDWQVFIILRKKKKGWWQQGNDFQCVPLLCHSWLRVCVRVHDLFMHSHIWAGFDSVCVCMDADPQFSVSVSVWSCVTVDPYSVSHCPKTLLLYCSSDPQATQRSHSKLPYICGSSVLLALLACSKTWRAATCTASVGSNHVPRTTVVMFN